MSIEEFRLLIVEVEGASEPIRLSFAARKSAASIRAMSVEQITNKIALLTEPELQELTAFLFHLRLKYDAEHQGRLESRLSDPKHSHWLSVEEFERRLEGA